jgi:hypothetical protein
MEEPTKFVLCPSSLILPTYIFIVMASGLCTRQSDPLGKIFGYSWSVPNCNVHTAASLHVYALNMVTLLERVLKEAPVLCLI